MTTEKFNHLVDLAFIAIRRTYGYTDESDEIVDLLCDMANVAEDEMTEK